MNEEPFNLNSFLKNLSNQLTGKRNTPKETIELCQKILKGEYRCCVVIMEGSTQLGDLNVAADGELTADIVTVLSDTHLKLQGAYMIKLQQGKMRGH